jgi:hypothetical protein
VVGRGKKSDLNLSSHSLLVDESRSQNSRAKSRDRIRRAALDSRP